MTHFILLLCLIAKNKNFTSIRNYSKRNVVEPSKLNKQPRTMLRAHLTLVDFDLIHRRARSRRVIVVEILPTTASLSPFRARDITLAGQLPNCQINTSRSVSFNLHSQNIWRPPPNKTSRQRLAGAHSPRYRPSSQTRKWYSQITVSIWTIFIVRRTISITQIPLLI